MTSYFMEELAKNQGNLRPLVLGLGRSGRAVGAYLNAQAMPFFVYDDRGETASESVVGHWQSASWLPECAPLPVTCLVISPGVPMTHPLVRRAMDSGIAVLSELEIASRLTAVPLVAITGTNGKSTTTALLSHFLTAAGMKVTACGNFGVPLLDVLLADPNWDG